MKLRITLTGLLLVALLSAFPNVSNQQTTSKAPGNQKFSPDTEKARAQKQKAERMSGTVRRMSKLLTKAKVPFEPTILFARNWKTRVRPYLQSMPEMSKTETLPAATSAGTGKEGKRGVDGENGGTLSWTMDPAVSWYSFSAKGGRGGQGGEGGPGGFYAMGGQGGDGGLAAVCPCTQFSGNGGPGGSGGRGSMGGWGGKGGPGADGGRGGKTSVYRVITPGITQPMLTEA